ncbi:calcium-binding protein [Caulobacter sp. 17J65-9]|uniref:calcium-binding protein n=1 Tax=Caulobacter sp. 17J65-9 TaxID=2709382 RepID=UPI0032048E99
MATIIGTSGDDHLIGGDEDDLLLGRAGDDLLEGGAGDDTLRGEAGDDVLDGGAGDDLLRGGEGVDTFIGGDGFDRVSFYEATATQGVIADLRTQTILNDGFGNAETMSSIEGLGAGTRFADTFYGDDADNLILASTGDTAYGFGGNDSFQVDGAAALIDGGAGVDTITMFTQTRLVDTNGDGIAEVETTTDGVWVDLAAGRIRNDGFGGSGVITGVENVGGSVGDDILVGDAGDNVLRGLDGNDSLRGGAGNDVLDGGAGDDQLRGGSGVDTFIGGDGFDRVSFYDADATQGVVADLRTQIILNDGFGNTETMSSIEGLGAGTRFADTFYGNDADNLILVGGGDTAYGFGGNDSFQVDGAPALIDGGSGVDTVTMFTQTRLVDLNGDGIAEVETTTDGVWVDLAAGRIRNDGFGGSGVITGVENVGGSYGDDILVGDAGDNVLRGLDGNDSLRGGAGNDVLDGGAGDDQLRGGSGVDTFIGGDGFDRVSFYDADATQGVIADLRTQTILNDGFGNTETMSSIEGLGAGTRFADTFYGDDHDNLILVSTEDTAYGFSGNDSFQVDGAAVLIDGGAGVDTISSFTLSRMVDADGDGIGEVQYATSGVEVDLSISSIVNDGFGDTGTVWNVENVGGSYLDDRLTGDENANTLWGFDGNDELNGGGGDDFLLGGAGDDRLEGGDGHDVLTGGEGADTFVFFGLGSGGDTVTDFETGADHLLIAGVGGVDDFSDLVITHNAAGDVVISAAGFDPITLTGVTSITADDVVFGDAGVDVLGDPLGGGFDLLGDPMGGKGHGGDYLLFA